MYTVIAAIDEMKREEIRERTSAAMLHHQANGRRMTRSDRCPYGWKPDPADPDSLVEDAREQAIIARIRQEHQKGEGLRAIARSLDQAGITSRGKRWSHSTIRSVLRRVEKLREAPQRHP